MEQKKSLGFGARGWILIFVMFSGMVSFMVFRNYPVNILADFYGGAAPLGRLLTTLSLHDALPIWYHCNRRCIWHVPDSD